MGVVRGSPGHAGGFVIYPRAKGRLGGFSIEEKQVSVFRRAFGALWKAAWRDVRVEAGGQYECKPAVVRL